MPKDNWIKALEQKLPEMIDCYICEQCAGGGSGAWEGKGQEPCSLCKGRGISIDNCDSLINFISQVEKDAIEKTKQEFYDAKQWQQSLNMAREKGYLEGVEKTNKRLLKIARLAKFWGDRPHVCPKCNHRFSEDALAEDIKKLLSDLLEDKK